MREYDSYPSPYPSPWLFVVGFAAVAAFGFVGEGLTGATLAPAHTGSEGEATVLEQFETRHAITVLDEPAPRLPSGDGERADVTLLLDGLVRDCTVFWVRDDWHVQCATRGGSTVVVLEQAGER